jgi:two-component system, NarL family, response regulator NreC
MPISCLIVDDHTLFREGIRHLLGGDPEIEVIGEAYDASDALDKVGALRPDVVLLDIGMPGLSSFEAARSIDRNWPRTRTIFLTMYEDEEYLLQSLDAGASGYMLKDVPAPELLEAVREVSRGRKYLSPRVLEKVLNPREEQGPRATRLDSLTPREREIVKMLAEGRSVRETAQSLSLSAKTVEAHKFNLMRKLQIHNTAQLVAYAIQKKIVYMPLGA